MGGNGIRQAARLLDPRKGCQDFRRHLLVELHILIEEGQQGTHQHIDFTIVDAGTGAQCFDMGGEKVIGQLEAGDTGTLGPLHQHLDCAIGKLQQLQDGGQGTDAMDVIHLGIIHLGAFLSDQQDFLVIRHGRVQGLDGFFATHKQGDDHVRVDHHIAQGQHGHHVLGAIGHFIHFVLTLHRGYLVANSLRRGLALKGAASSL